jgi:hypothetical protein
MITSSRYFHAMSGNICRLLAAFSFVSAAGAADFTVTNASDSGVGSLRQAILLANANPGHDRVLFAIPGAGVRVIEVAELPAITDPLTIDGYTQAGARPNSLQNGSDAVINVEVRNAANRNGENGLVVQAGGCVIRGLALNGFLYGAEAVFLKRGAAIKLEGPGGNIVEGNFIGTRADGQTAAPNAFGIELRSPGNIVGGTSPAQRNIISASRHSGVSIFFQPDNAIRGNYIGTDASGMVAVANRTGIHASGQNQALRNTIIGGAVNGAQNVISGNSVGIGLGAAGDAMLYNVAADVTVQGNVIGAAGDGLSPLGNGIGVVVDGSSNLIGGSDGTAGNVIAFNAHGVNIRRGTANRVLSNRIFGNTSASLDLGFDGPATPNDPADPDGGANNLQNHPVVTSTTFGNGSVAIQGRLNSTPNQQFTVQFFADSLSLTQPRQTYLGSIEVNTDANGDASFATTFATNLTNVAINATATSTDGDTSEFFLNPPRFRNISTRAHVQHGEGALIGGFIMQNTSAHVIVRALGPSMRTGATPVAGTLDDPVLEVYDPFGQPMATNDNWREDGAAGTVQQAGLAPADDREAALYRPFSNAGAYTVLVRGKDGATGVALVEAYHFSTGSTPTQPSPAMTANLSTRGMVGTGDDVLIGGLMLGSGEGTARVVARAIGASLRRVGIANALNDPVLELHDGNGTMLARNDDWRDTQQAELQAVGLAPEEDRDAAILTRLQAGAYTAIVRGAANSTGIAVVELYNLQ